MEYKKITDEMKKALLEPLPQEAVSQHPSKTFLSTIKAIYVTERLNDVFGVGSWKIKTDFVEKVDKMVVVKTILEIPEYGVYYEVFGGNDNSDLGDAYKGATTDGITKIGSYLGIGIDVFKGKQTHNSSKQNTSNSNSSSSNESTSFKMQRVDFKEADNIRTESELIEWYKKNEPLLKTEAQKQALINICQRRKKEIFNMLQYKE